MTNVQSLPNRVPMSVRELKRMAQCHTQEALEAIEQSLRFSMDPKVRMEAAKLMLSIAYGNELFSSPVVEENKQAPNTKEAQIRFINQLSRLKDEAPSSTK